MIALRNLTVGAFIGFYGALLADRAMATLERRTWRRRR